MSATGLMAQLDLPSLFSTGAVLQRDQAIPIWGKASANATVSVSFNGATASGQADGNGRWRVDLPAMAAGGPFTLSISSSGQNYDATDNRGRSKSVEAI